MRQAKKSRPYEINQFEQENILNFTEHSDFCNWDDLKITSVKEFSVVSGDCNVYLKYSYDAEAQKMNLFNKRIKVEDFIAFQL